MVVIALAACSTRSSRVVRIGAAADLARAFEEVGKAFEARTHTAPVFTFDSSGLLAKRIDEGAPFALFASANRDYAADVIAHGRCDAASLAPYAQGRIVVWTPTGTPPPKSLAELADPRFRRVAIANPEHAPYGKAAQQAIEKAGLWDALQPKLKYGESVQTTMQYAKSGAVDAAIVALSLAVVADGGSFMPIDQSQYEPLEQDLVVCDGGGVDAAEADAARQFAAFVASPEGREIMTRYGFVLPPAAPVPAPAAPAPAAPPAPAGSATGSAR